mgnify:CR=1 FL=1
MSDDVAAVDLGTGHVALTHLSPREEDADFCWCGLLDTELGPLAIWELGVIAFNMAGTTRWRAEVPTFQWRFGGVKGDQVLFKHEFEGTWLFDLRDGSKETEASR